MKLLLKYMDRMPKIIIAASSSLLVVFLGIIDYASGSEISFSIFYLLPVLMASGSPSEDMES